MSFITLKCKNCGSTMTLNTDSSSATCTHCGSSFLLSELLDEKDIAFAQSISPKDLDNKIQANDALKKGDTCLYQAEYDKAESFYKKAIELDENNYRGYLGVVKAKTHNLNEIPPNDDYVQYASYATSLAENEDLVIVQSELSKLDLLVREKNKQKKMRFIEKQNKEQLKIQKSNISKLFSLLALFILLMFAAAIVVSVLFSKGALSNSSASKVYVDNYEKFAEVMTDSSYANYEIYLSADIDCENHTIEPFASQSIFTGSLHGNYHKISNLNINIPEFANVNYFGLFGETKGAYFYDLVLDNVDINSSSTSFSNNINYYGVLVGKAERTTFNNIEIRNTCEIVVNCSSLYSSSIGGAVGYSLNYSILTNISCHTEIKATLTNGSGSGQFNVGGIVGLSKNSTINTCCSNSDITTYMTSSTTSTLNGYAGGIVGYVSNPSITETFKIRNNMFSGSINASTSKFNCQISAIASCGNEAISNQNNYCLFTDNFIKNSVELTQSNLADYQSTHLFVSFYTSNQTYTIKLAELFSSSTWTNQNSHMPQLRAE